MTMFKFLASPIEQWKYKEQGGGWNCPAERKAIGVLFLPEMSAQSAAQALRGNPGNASLV